MQLTLLKKDNKELFKSATQMSRESVIKVTGIVQENKQAKDGWEILPKDVKILSAAQTPLPMGIVDKVGADLNTRLDNRFIDLRKNEVATIFKIRSHLIAGIREYLRSQDFVEINTPKIVAAGAEGGAILFPINYFDKKAYLAQSPQLYKQTLMGTGLDRIFEIAPAYRAEASDTVRHLSEFTSLDVELAFIESSEDVMQIIEGIIVSSLAYVKEHAADELALLEVDVNVPKTPFRRIPHRKCVEIIRAHGKNANESDEIDTEGEKILGDVMLKEHGEEFYFITEFPTELKRSVFYAMRNDDNPELTQYFDLEYKGQELVSGGQREHRYDVLIAQIQENNLPRESFDFYLKAFRYGMPPHGGFGLGIERYLQKMLNLCNVREAVLFPRDRVRLIP
jgi:aspartyl-tRNA synthetase